MPAPFKRLSVSAVCVVLLIALLGGCASTGDPRDPFEPLNRGIYQFNDAFDRAIMKPVAQGYRAVLPQFVRSSVSNFFSNINDILVALNNLLQGKFTTFVSDFGRIAINSTLGIGGLFDIASEAGIEKHDEDFGQTLGWWGMGDGPFIMLPFFGPSNARDLIGRVVDYYSDPITYVRPRHVRNITWGTRIVNRRSELLDASTILETAALDPYEFVRDAYIQRRRSLIHDGSPPPEIEYIEPQQPKSPRGQSPGSYLSSAEPGGGGEGAILVSGESRTPVKTVTGIEVRAAVTQQAALPTAHGTKEPAAASLSANVPTPAELESLLQSLPTVATVRRTARAADVLPASGL